MFRPQPLAPASLTFPNISRIGGPTPRPSDRPTGKDPAPGLLPAHRRPRRPARSRPSVVGSAHPTHLTRTETRRQSGSGPRLLSDSVSDSAVSYGVRVRVRLRPNPTRTRPVVTPGHKQEASCEIKSGEESETRFWILMGKEDSGEHTGGAEAEAAVHIVYVLQPEGGEEPEAFHVRTLASVLGSEAAAREALVYSYSHAASGFAAKLTPHQAAEIQKLPDVLQVQPDRVYELHAGPTTFHQAHDHDL